MWKNYLAMAVNRQVSSGSLNQINAKDYAQPFAANGRRVVKIDVNFATQTRTITDWLVER